MTPWPPIPAHVLSESTAPAQRLRDLAAFSRETPAHTPTPGTISGSSILWDCADPQGFAALMAERTTA
jgi:hypothetical protein